MKPPMSRHERSVVAQDSQVHQGLSRWEGQTTFFLIKPDRMSEKGLSPLLSLRSQARKFQERESSHRMGHGGHSGCALLKRWRCSVCTDEQCTRAKLPPRGTHTLSLIMEGFLHPLEYRWSAWSSSKKPMSSQTLLWKQGELKRAGWRKGAGHTVAKFCHLTLPKSRHRCTSENTDFGDVMYKKLHMLDFQSLQNTSMHLRFVSANTLLQKALRISAVWK